MSVSESESDGKAVLGDGIGAIVAFLFILALQDISLYLLRSSIPGALLSISAIVLLFQTRPEGFLAIPIIALFSFGIYFEKNGWIRMLWIPLVSGLLFIGYYVGVLKQYNYPAQYTINGILFSWSPNTVVWMDPGFTPVIYMVFFFWSVVVFLSIRNEQLQLKTFLAMIAILTLLAFFYSAMPARRYGYLELASARYQTMEVIVFLFISAYGLASL